MAWIKIYQSLREHHKVLDAADDLGIDPAHMIGLLVSLWTWALDNAPTGSLAGVGVRTIARAAQWTGSPEGFVETMEARNLLDCDNNGNYSIHNWLNYAGKLIDEREKERTRSAERRAKNKAIKEAEQTTELSTDDRQTTSKRPPDDRQTTVGRVEQSRVDKSRVDKSINTPLPPEGEKSEHDIQTRRFVEFWKAYPKKVGKKAALTAWKRIKPDADLFDRIMAAVETAKATEQWQREGGRFIPNPATWINQGRWDDELPVAGSTYQNPGKPNTMGVLAGIIAGEEGGGVF